MNWGAATIDADERKANGRFKISYKKLLLINFNRQYNHSILVES